MKGSPARVGVTPVRVSDATSRIEMRRRRRQFRRIRLVGIVIVALALVAGGGWLIGFSPVFAIESVAVTGTSLLSADLVEKTAEAPMGSPLAMIDPDLIAARVAAIPEVEAVTVSRSWPHTVTIAITERTPIYAMQSTKAGEHWLVDRAGVAFHLVAKVPQGLLPVKSASTDAALLRDAATVITALPEKLRKRVTSVEVMSVDSIVLTLTANMQVVWGSASDSQLKGQVAEALLQVPAKVIDVSSPTSPVTR